MIGLLQIMIYLFCVYLVYKGIEIFQIAFVSSGPPKARTIGIVLGIIVTIGAFGIGAGAVFFTDKIATSIGDNMKDIPRLR